MIIYLFFFRGEVRIFKKKPFGTCLRGVSGSCRLQGLTKLSFPYFLDTWYYRVFHQVTKISHFLAGIQMSFMAFFFLENEFQEGTNFVPSLFTLQHERNHALFVEINSQVLAKPVPLLCPSWTLKRGVFRGALFFSGLLWTVRI